MGLTKAGGCNIGEDGCCVEGDADVGAELLGAVASQLEVRGLNMLMKEFLY